MRSHWASFPDQSKVSHTPASEHILNTARNTHPTPSWAFVYMSPLNWPAPWAKNWVKFFSVSPRPAQPEPRRRPVNYCWMNEWIAKNTCAFVEPGWPFSERPGNSSAGRCAVCQMVCGILLPKCKFSLESSFLWPVPDSETGSWQFWLPWTLAHPWATLAWTGGMETLGLPESCPGLCQDRRLKITQSCFHASSEGGHSLSFILLLAVGLWVRQEALRTSSLSVTY